MQKKIAEVECLVSYLRAAVHQWFIGATGYSRPGFSVTDPLFLNLYRLNLNDKNHLYERNERHFVDFHVQFVGSSKQDFNSFPGYRQERYNKTRN